MSRHTSSITLGLCALLIAVLASCSTAPKAVDRATFKVDADTATKWFTNNVSGLQDQIDSSAAYIVFPDVAQWGIVITGGRRGRGALMRPDGTQEGWAAIGTFSLGLQAGVQGFKMFIVHQDEATVVDFKAGKWTGSASAIAVGGDAGGVASSPFTKGMAVYQGANTGLMAGVNVGLDNIKYQALGDEG